MTRLAAIILICWLAWAPGADGATILTGAGATFPYPLYQHWFDAYQAQTGVRIDYRPIGSGGGIRALLDQSVDFGATDAFLSDESLAEAPRTIHHLPTCLGAVALVYHLPGNPPLKLSPQIISGVFLGTITRWSDPAIYELNPQTPLPDLNITVVHRSESSGTTFIFSDYLSKISPQWRGRFGRSKQIAWPVGMGLEKSQNIAEIVKKIPGSIGYVQLNYARELGLSFASIQNRFGNFVYPTLESVSEAARVRIPMDTRILITDTLAAQGYPISALTYIIIYGEQAYQNRDREHVRELTRLLAWMVGEGQKDAASLDYAPLPAASRYRAEDIIRSITYAGSTLDEN